jgi:hypothetical protein
VPRTSVQKVLSILCNSVPLDTWRVRLIEKSFCETLALVKYGVIAVYPMLGYLTGGSNPKIRPTGEVGY